MIKIVKNMKNRVDSHGASYRILETVRRQNADCFCRITEYLSKSERRSGMEKEEVGYGGNERNY